MYAVHLLSEVVKCRPGGVGQHILVRVRWLHDRGHPVQVLRALGVLVLHVVVRVVAMVLAVTVRACGQHIIA